MTGRMQGIMRVRTPLHTHLTCAAAETLPTAIGRTLLTTIAPRGPLPACLHARPCLGSSVARPDPAQTAHTPLLLALAPALHPTRVAPDPPTYRPAGTACRLTTGAAAFGSAAIAHHLHTNDAALSEVICVQGAWQGQQG